MLLPKWLWDMKRSPRRTSSVRTLVPRTRPSTAATTRYYACFHAARAVLYDRGFTPDSHQGVLSLFGRHVVQSGDASPEQGRFLNEMMRERLTADYEHEPVSLDLDETYERTEYFVEALQDVVDDG